MLDGLGLLLIGLKFLYSLITYTTNRKLIQAGKDEVRVEALQAALGRVKDETEFLNWVITNPSDAVRLKLREGAGRIIAFDPNSFGSSKTKHNVS